MFSGIIQNLGQVINFENNELEISTLLDLSDCKVGSSICCNGVCLTATKIDYRDKEYYFKVNIGEETLEKTNLSHNALIKYNKINIEKSLKIGEEISGHFVYGHIDRTTTINKINKLNHSWEFFFNNFHNKDKKFIVEKGSIAINGISLTIAKVTDDYFSISIIPHTFENTNLKFLNNEDLVNVEFDYLARFSLDNIK